MRCVVVIGAGPAGLAHAFWLGQSEPDTEVRVFEAAPMPGGHLRTERRDGYVCEWGPQAVRPTDGFAALVSALDLDAALVPAQPALDRRWLGRGGRLHALPNGPGGFLRSGIVSLSARLRALGELFVKPDGGRPDESLAEFVGRRFGKGLVPLADAMVSGIFAGRASELEAASAFPQLVGLEQEHRSVVRGLARRAKQQRPDGPKLVTFDAGMSGLVSALAERHTPVCGAGVRAVGHAHGRTAIELDDGTRTDADEVVVAVPARVAARLLEELDSSLGAELAAIPFVPIVNVYLGWPRCPDEERQRGFGFLLDAGEPTEVIGTIYASELFPDHAPPQRSLFRVMMGGARHPDILERSDAELQDAAVAALVNYVGVRGAPEFAHVVRIPNAIPQYAVGHADRLARIDDRVARYTGLSLRGNSYRGVALGDQLGPQPVRAASAAVA